MKSALVTNDMEAALLATGTPTDYPKDEGEILRLVQRHQETGCARSLDRLTRHHHRMCLSIANKYKHRFDVDDSYQDCMESLIHCVKEFDVTSGYRFFSYAYTRIKREVGLKKILQWSTVSVSTSKEFLKAFRYMGTMLDYSEMTQALAKDIAEELNVTVSIVMNAYSIRRQTMLSLDCPTEENGLSLMESLADHLSPEEIVMELEFEREMKSMTKNAFSSLTPKEATVIQMRHLQEAPLTLMEAGAQLGVSGERVRQIESAAIKKMKVAA